ncbi:ParB/RepB/Spo0J family partition protein [Chitinimonas naiadis]
MTHAQQAFDGRTISVKLDRLIPTRTYTSALTRGAKFLSVISSIQELGIIEPLIVYPEDPDHLKTTNYLVLDGGYRLVALRQLRAKTALCIVAHDDEGFTYNRQLNRVGAVQEHRMILTAIQRGLSPERIATVLRIDVKRVHQRTKLLDGIAPEAAEALKDQLVAARVFDILRKMKPMRQIETAELMMAAGRFSAPYAEMIYLSSSPEMLIGKKIPIKKCEPQPEDIAKMEREMAKLQERYVGIEQKVGDTMLTLVVTSAYVNRLMQNKAVSNFIKRYHAELEESLNTVLELVSSESKRLKRE